MMELSQIVAWAVWLIFCFYVGTRLGAYLRKIHQLMEKHTINHDINSTGLSLIQAKDAAIRSGKKIRHNSFMNHHYIYYKNGCWFTQDGHQMPEVCFLNEHEPGWWSDGWSVL